MSAPEDRLSAVLERFPVRAGIFHSGPVCGTFDFDREVKPGQFHLVRSGVAELTGTEGIRRISEPSIIFMPDAASHRLVAESEVELICATVRFGTSGPSPVVGALPALVVVKLADSPRLAVMADLMFDEVRDERPGRQVVLNRLCELAIVKILRLCLEWGLVHGGTLAGLADAQLAKALAAMHRQPEREWSLDGLAALAGMSRARFAVRFRETVGSTPGDHLTACRVARAQQLLREGCSLKAVADQVGYGSASALTRAFTRSVGSAPQLWRARDKVRRSP